MAKNTYKPKESADEAPQQKSAKKTRNIDIEELVTSLPAHYKSYAAWLFLLVFFMIFFSHAYEGYIRDIEKLKREIDHKRSEYISRKASFMRNTKKSTLLKELQTIGLEENLEPPKKIKVTDW